MHNSPHGQMQSTGSYGAVRSQHPKLWLQPLVQLSSPCLNLGHPTCQCQAESGVGMECFCWGYYWMILVSFWDSLHNAQVSFPSSVDSFSPQHGFPIGSEVKNLPANTGDVSLIPGSGRSPGEGNGNSLWYSCLENPVGRGAWQAADDGVVKSRIGLSD